MSKDATLNRFIKRRPVAVMARLINQMILNEDLDIVFEEHRQRQYERDMLFSQLAITMADVVLGTEKSPHQAYKSHREDLQVSAASFYEKLSNVETSVSEGMVRYAYEKARDLQDQLGFVPSEPIPGYHARVIDGNHLQQTQKRIGKLRGIASAALPGTVVATYELGRELFDRAYLLEDAHAQESTVLDRVLGDLQEHDLIIADRHFCILAFLAGIILRNAVFVIRQHGRLKGELVGKRKKIGRIDTGTVFEQQIRAGSMTLRRVTAELDEPTREGDTELHILTNIPKSRADGRKIARLYRQRWEIENGFHVLMTTMTCEVKSLGHPLAALFVFCTAMLAYNGMRVLAAALVAAHGEDTAEELSAYSLSLEIAKAADGLLVLFTENEWKSLLPKTNGGRAKFLIDVAAHLDTTRHRKTHRGPKKKPPKRTGYRNGGHVSTAKILGITSHQTP
jgi:Transposase DDE domain